MESINPLLWLKEHALPLWMEVGFDRATGLFIETLSPDGRPVDSPRRAMVQARQIYTLRVARDLGIVGNDARQMVDQAARSLIQKYSLPSGAFAHAVDQYGKIIRETPDLYAQGFSLFGLAHAYGVTKESQFKERAIRLIEYLQKDRRLSEGGYSEIKSGSVTLEANPHMHLFEAALAWAQEDSDSYWMRLAEELANLCVSKFIDPASGALCEFFDRGWKPSLHDGRYVVEPGHQFEWAWLFMRYQPLSQREEQVRGIVKKLVDSAEQRGINRSQYAVDEVWNDGAVKTASARFWPQTERVKAHSILSHQGPAHAALTALGSYFTTSTPGLWFDRRGANGEFTVEPVRASGLYHIIGAISEFYRAWPDCKLD